jgi:amino-acid N-acetyltransferase
VWGVKCFSVFLSVLSDLYGLSLSCLFSLNLCASAAILLVMNVRNAKVSDARAINALVGSYAERDRMLFRSVADIYENLQTFTVAEMDGSIVGCCALEIIWSDLAEIKSLAVDISNNKKGIGKKLVEAALEKAAEMGVARVFALTLEPEFFEKLGFTKVDTETLPMKVWSDCARCPKQQHCDEIAVLKVL